MNSGMGIIISGFASGFGTGFGAGFGAGFLAVVVTCLTIIVSYLTLSFGGFVCANVNIEPQQKNTTKEIGKNNVFFFISINFAVKKYLTGC